MAVRSFFQKRCLGRQHKGFTLVEAVVTIVLVTVIGIGAISSVLVARELAEYDKQRIAAMSAARAFLEEKARHDLFPTLGPLGSTTLDNFNTPTSTDDLQATVEMKIYEVNADGSRGAELVSSPTTDDRVEVEITVSWDRTGRLSTHRVSETLSTYVSPDL